MRALELMDLDAFYGKSHILHGVGLRVGAGELVALLGRNGAGKTTTLKAIMGLLPKRRGRILVFGQETIHAPPHQVALLGVGYVPEGRRIFPYLTVEENLRLVQGKRPGPFSLERVYEIFPRLWERRRHLGRQLSGGEQEMLAIGRALLLNPRLLLLDEPSQGLAPLVVRLVAEVLRGLKKEGVSLLLAEQNAHLALDLADRVYVLDDGRVAYEGEAKALREDPERVRALTGVRRR